MWYGYGGYVEYYQAIIQKLLEKSKDDRILNRLGQIAMGDDEKRFERVQKLLDDFNISVAALLCSDSEDETTENTSAGNSKKNEEKK
jgi:hypothetical protein